MTEDQAIGAIESLQAGLSRSQWSRPEVWELAKAGSLGAQYRLRFVAQAVKTLEKSLREHGSAPPPNERFIQERALFLLYTSAHSVFECLAFVAYAIATHLQRDGFELESEADQRNVSLAGVGKALARLEDPSSKMLAALIGELQESEILKTVSKKRNVLLHRAHPGRLIRLGPDEATWKAPMNSELSIDVLLGEVTEVYQCASQLAHRVSALLSRDLP